MPDIRLAGTPQDYIGFTGTYTANTGNNRLIVAVVGYKFNSTSTNPGLTVVLGSKTLTTLHFQIRSTTGGNGYGAIGVAYLKDDDIPTGAQSFTVTVSPPAAAAGAVTFYTLENVDQITPIFNSYQKNFALSNGIIVNTINATAGGFSIHAGCTDRSTTQPFSVTDSTWTERRDYKNAGNDFGFFIYDKLYSTNKTENLAVTFSTTTADCSIATVAFNPFVSNKVRFDTSANGNTLVILQDTGTPVSTITASVPTNVKDGDMMVAVILNNNGNNPGSISTPAGWTVLANNSNENGNFTCHTWIGYKIASSEPSSYTWDIISNYHEDIACIFKVPGFDRRNPIEAIGSFSGGDFSPKINSLTTSNTSTVFYILGAKRGNDTIAANNTFVSPNNSTQVLYLVSSVAERGTAIAIAYEDVPIGKTIYGKQFNNVVISGGSRYSSTFAFAVKQAPYSTVQADRLVETGRVKRFTDNFNRADTSFGDIGPNWDTIRGDFRIINNQFDGTGFCYAKVSETVVDFSDDHSAQITVRALGVADPLGPAVRVNANGCYVLRCDGGTTGERRINYVNGTTYTIIGNVTITPNVGDTLKLTAQGSVITAYRNGVQVDQVSNTAYTTGQPGIHYNRSNINTSKGDDFIAEDLNSPTSGTMVKMFDDGTIQAGYFSEKEYLDRIKYHFDGDVWAGKFIESE